MAQDYTKLKNPQLETLLKERQLPHSGKKAEMVARLQDYDRANAAAAAATTAPTPAEPPKETTAAPATAPPSSDAAAKPAPGPDTAKPDADLADAPAEADKKEGEAAPAADFSSHLPTTDVDKELAKRRARAAKFGLDAESSDAIKSLERMKRFGTGVAAVEGKGEGVGRLDEALSERRERRKRGRGGDEGEGVEEDPGLIKRRRGGGFRGGGGGGGGGASWMSEADRKKAEARKAKFG